MTALSTGGKSGNSESSVAMSSEAFYFFLVESKFTQKLIKPDTFSRHIQKNHRIAHDDGGYIYNKYYKFN
jgi:hypothetical protein